MDSMKKVPLVVEAVDTGDDVAGRTEDLPADFGGVEGSGTVGRLDPAAWAEGEIGVTGEGT